MDNICTSQSIGVTDILASLLHSTGCQFDTNYSSIIRVGTATTVLLRGPWEIHKGFVPQFNFMILLHVNSHNVECARTKQPFSLAVQEKSVDLAMMFQPFFVFTLQKYWVSYSPSGFIGPTVSETDSKMKSSVASLPGWQLFSLTDFYKIITILHVSELSLNLLLVGNVISSKCVISVQCSFEQLKHCILFVMINISLWEWSSLVFCYENLTNKIVFNYRLVLTVWCWHASCLPRCSRVS